MKVKEPIYSSHLRETLKVFMKNEIENLPSTLELLEPRERLNAVIKLLPYVCPKVESIDFQRGEPMQLDGW